MKKCLCLLVLMFLSSIRGTATNGGASIRPPLLKEKDKVAIVAPAFQLPDADVENVIETTTKMLQSWGLEVVLGKYVRAKYYAFAGKDEQRAEDLQWAVDDPTIKAIFMLRGGYGITRIMDQLDFTHLLKNPKWVIGFSDITALHMQLHKLGMVSAHGEMPCHFVEPQYKSSITSLRTLLFKGTAQLMAPPHASNRLGSTTAPVVGGNLTLICNNMETSSALDTKGKILVIEDVGGYLYALDRAMVHLKRAGKLQHLAGLVVGGMVDTKDNPAKPFGKTAEEIIQEHVAAYDYPVAFNLPVGHEAPNLAFPHGSTGTLCVENNKVSLVFGN